MRPNKMEKFLFATILVILFVSSARCDGQTPLPPLPPSNPFFFGTPAPFNPFVFPGTISPSGVPSGTPVPINPFFGGFGNPSNIPPNGHSFLPVFSNPSNQPQAPIFIPASAGFQGVPLNNQPQQNSPHVLFPASTAPLDSVQVNQGILQDGIPREGHGNFNPSTALPNEMKKRIGDFPENAPTVPVAVGGISPDTSVAPATHEVNENPEQILIPIKSETVATASPEASLTTAPPLPSPPTELPTDISEGFTSEPSLSQGHLPLASTESSPAVEDIDNTDPGDNIPDSQNIRPSLATRIEQLKMQIGQSNNDEQRGKTNTNTKETKNENSFFQGTIESRTIEDEPSLILPDSQQNDPVVHDSGKTFTFDNVPLSSDTPSAGEIKHEREETPLTKVNAINGQPDENETGQFADNDYDYVIDYQDATIQTQDPTSAIPSTTSSPSTTTSTASPTSTVSPAMKSTPERKSKTPRPRTRTRPSSRAQLLERLKKLRERRLSTARPRPPSDNQRSTNSTSPVRAAINRRQKNRRRPANRTTDSDFYNRLRNRIFTTRSPRRNTTAAAAAAAAAANPEDNLHLPTIFIDRPTTEKPLSFKERLNRYRENNRFIPAGRRRTTPRASTASLVTSALTTKQESNVKEIVNTFKADQEFVTPSLTPEVASISAITTEVTPTSAMTTEVTPESKMQEIRDRIAAKLAEKGISETTTTEEVLAALNDVTERNIFTENFLFTTIPSATLEHRTDTIFNPTVTVSIDGEGIQTEMPLDELLTTIVDNFETSKDSLDSLVGSPLVTGPTTLTTSNAVSFSIASDHFSPTSESVPLTKLENTVESVNIKDISRPPLSLNESLRLGNVFIEKEPLSGSGIIHEIEQTTSEIPFTTAEVESAKFSTEPATTTISGEPKSGDSAIQEFIARLIAQGIITEAKSEESLQSPPTTAVHSDTVTSAGVTAQATAISENTTDKTIDATTLFSDTLFGSNAKSDSTVPSLEENAASTIPTIAVDDEDSLITFIPFFPKTTLDPFLSAHDRTDQPITTTEESVPSTPLISKVKMMDTTEKFNRETFDPKTDIPVTTESLFFPQENFQTTFRKPLFDFPGVLPTTEVPQETENEATNKIDVDNSDSMDHLHMLLSSFGSSSARPELAAMNRVLGLSLFDPPTVNANLEEPDLLNDFHYTDYDLEPAATEQVVLTTRLETFPFETEAADQRSVTESMNDAQDITVFENLIPTVLNMDVASLTVTEPTVKVQNITEMQSFNTKTDEVTNNNNEIDSDVNATENPVNQVSEESEIFNISKASGVSNPSNKSMMGEADINKNNTIHLNNLKPTDNLTATDTKELDNKNEESKSTFSNIEHSENSEVRNGEIMIKSTNNEVTVDSHTDKQLHPMQTEISTGSTLDINKTGESLVSDTMTKHFPSGLSHDLNENQESNKTLLLIKNVTNADSVTHNSTDNISVEGQHSGRLSDEKSSQVTEQKKVVNIVSIQTAFETTTIEPFVVSASDIMFQKASTSETITNDKPMPLFVHPEISFTKFKENEQSLAPKGIPERLTHAELPAQHTLQEAETNKDDISNNPSKDSEANLKAAEGRDRPDLLLLLKDRDTHRRTNTETPNFSPRRGSIIPPNRTRTVAKNVPQQVPRARLSLSQLLSQRTTPSASDTETRTGNRVSNPPSRFGDTSQTFDTGKGTLAFSHTPVTKPVVQLPLHARVTEKPLSHAPVTKPKNELPLHARVTGKPLSQVPVTKPRNELPLHARITEKPFSHAPVTKPVVDFPLHARVTEKPHEAQASNTRTETPGDSEADKQKQLAILQFLALNKARLESLKRKQTEATTIPDNVSDTTTIADIKILSEGRINNQQTTFLKPRPRFLNITSSDTPSKVNPSRNRNLPPPQSRKNPPQFLLHARKSSTSSPSRPNISQISQSSPSSPAPKFLSSPTPRSKFHLISRSDRTSPAPRSDIPSARQSDHTSPTPRFIDSEVTRFLSSPSPRFLSSQNVRTNTRTGSDSKVPKFSNQIKDLIAAVTGSNEGPTKQPPSFLIPLTTESVTDSTTNVPRFINKITRQNQATEHPEKNRKHSFSTAIPTTPRPSSGSFTTLASLLGSKPQSTSIESITTPNPQTSTSLFKEFTRKSGGQNLVTFTPVTDEPYFEESTTELGPLEFEPVTMPVEIETTIIPTIDEEFTTDVDFGQTTETFIGNTLGFESGKTVSPPTSIQTSPGSPLISGFKPSSFTGRQTTTVKPKSRPDINRSIKRQGTITPNQRTKFVQRLQDQKIIFDDRNIASTTRAPNSATTMSSFGNTRFEASATTSSPHSFFGFSTTDRKPQAVTTIPSAFVPTTVSPFSRSNANLDITTDSSFTITPIPTEPPSTSPVGVFVDQNEAFFSDDEPTTTPIQDKALFSSDPLSSSPAQHEAFSSADVLSTTLGSTDLDVVTSTETSLISTLQAITTTPRIILLALPIANSTSLNGLSQIVSNIPNAEHNNRHVTKRPPSQILRNKGKGDDISTSSFTDNQNSELRNKFLSSLRPGVRPQEHTTTRTRFFSDQPKDSPFLQQSITEGVSIKAEEGIINRNPALVQNGFEAPVNHPDFAPSGFSTTTALPLPATTQVSSNKISDFNSVLTGGGGVTDNFGDGLTTINPATKNSFPTTNPPAITESTTQFVPNTQLHSIRFLPTETTTSRPSFTTQSSIHKDRSTTKSPNQGRILKKRPELPTGSTDASRTNKNPVANSFITTIPPSNNQKDRTTTKSALITDDKSAAITRPSVFLRPLTIRPETLTTLSPPTQDDRDPNVILNFQPSARIPEVTKKSPATNSNNLLPFSTTTSKPKLTTNRQTNTLASILNNRRKKPSLSSQTTREQVTTSKSIGDFQQPTTPSIELTAFSSTDQSDLSQTEPPFTFSFATGTSTLGDGDAENPPPNSIPFRFDGLGNMIFPSDTPEKINGSIVPVPSFAGRGSIRFTTASNDPLLSSTLSPTTQISTAFPKLDFTIPDNPFNGRGSIRFFLNPSDNQDQTLADNPDVFPLPVSTRLTPPPIINLPLNPVTGNTHTNSEINNPSPLPSSRVPASPSFITGPPSFTTSSPSFVTSPPSFNNGAPSFTTSPPSFSTSSPSFTNSPSFLSSNLPSFSTNSLSHTTNSPSFSTDSSFGSINPHSFIGNSPSFSTGSSFTTASPSFISSPPPFVTSSSSFTTNPPSFINTDNLSSFSNSNHSPGSSNQGTFSSPAISNSFQTITTSESPVFVTSDRDSIVTTTLSPPTNEFEPSGSFFTGNPSESIISTNPSVISTHTNIQSQNSDKTQSFSSFNTGNTESHISHDSFNSFTPSTPHQISILGNSNLLHNEVSTPQTSTDDNPMVVSSPSDLMELKNSNSLVRSSTPTTLEFVSFANDLANILSEGSALNNLSNPILSNNNTQIFNSIQQLVTTSSPSLVPFSSNSNNFHNSAHSSQGSALNRNPFVPPTNPPAQGFHSFSQEVTTSNPIFSSVSSDSTPFQNSNEQSHITINNPPLVSFPNGFRQNSNSFNQPPNNPPQNSNFFQQPANTTSHNSNSFRQSTNSNFFTQPPRNPSQSSNFFSQPSNNPLQRPSHQNTNSFSGFSNNQGQNSTNFQNQFVQTNSTLSIFSDNFRPFQNNNAASQQNNPRFTTTQNILRPFQNNNAASQQHNPRFTTTQNILRPFQNNNAAPQQNNPRFTNTQNILRPFQNTNAASQQNNPRFTTTPKLLRPFQNANAASQQSNPSFTTTPKILRPFQRPGFIHQPNIKPPSIISSSSGTLLTPITIQPHASSSTVSSIVTNFNTPAQTLPTKSPINDLGVSRPPSKVSSNFPSPIPAKNNQFSQNSFPSNNGGRRGSAKFTTSTTSSTTTPPSLTTRPSLALTSNKIPQPNLPTRGPTLLVPFGSGDESSLNGANVDKDPDNDHIPGEGGVDYPILEFIPETSFKCSKSMSKGGMMFADPETACQVYHVCNGHQKFSFLCPRGTIFHQETVVCQWWFTVDCQAQARKIAEIQSREAS